MTRDERLNKLEDEMQKMREKVNHSLREANKVLTHLKESISRLENLVNDLDEKYRLTDASRQDKFMGMLGEILKNKGKS